MNVSVNKLPNIMIIFDLEPLLAGYAGYAYMPRRPLVASNPLDKFAILSGIRIDEA
jgi:hypothetical protein